MLQFFAVQLEYDIFFNRLRVLQTKMSGSMGPETWEFS
jgi:hypothetical protein